tara:strand:+ start:248 stop:733 length:486 start_codon:yes stop_codon:yes gene_type:complete
MYAVRQQNSTRKHNDSMKPFCKVCKDFGKSESVFTSHFVRQTTHPNSPVTCPTILNNVCQYCGEKGHFVSSCSLKKTQLKEEKLFILSQKKLEKINNEEVKNVKTKNVFDILNEEDSSSSDEEEEEERKVEVISENVTIRKRKYTNWASIVDSDSESEDEE